MPRVIIRTAYWSRYVCWVPISFYIDDDGEMIVRAAVEVQIILN